MNVRRWLLAGLLSMLMLPFGHAQEYPNRPVRLVVPWPTGGSADIVMRVVSQRLQELWGQPVVIENRGGAAGNIGAEMVARAAPDGYTLLYGAMSTHAMNQWLYPKMTFDPVKDFEPICLMVVGTTVLVVPANSPANSVQELIAIAKAKPGQLNYGSVGIGSFSHLAGELLRSGANIDVTHVSYKGGAEALVDLVAGRLDFLFTVAPSALPYLRSGKLKLIAVADEKRSASFPDVPAIAESLPGFDISLWSAVLAPAGTPKPIVERINRDIRRVLEMPDVKSRLVEMGSVMVASSPEDFRLRMQSDAAKWRRVIRDAGVKVD
jgi:tripartite-type tricarboxylate transporter receptor subunit TctC